MNAPHVGSRDTSAPSTRTRIESAAMPSHTDLYWTVHTDSTSGMRRLNSSKHTQAPEEATPRKMFPRPW